MSKRTLEDTEVDTTISRKKSKKDKKEKKSKKAQDEPEQDVVAEEPAAVVEEDGEKKKKKKDKKEKKEKKEKKVKADAEEETETAAAEAPADVEAEAEGEVESKKEKKDKKKKDKKEKKEKKRKEKDQDEEGDTAMTNGHDSAPAATANGKSDITVDDVYQQTSALASVPQSEIDAFLSTNTIAITDPDSSNLRPILQFSHLPPTSLANNPKSPFASFKAPTPIQSASWPFGLAGRDIVGVAETGSGKTLGFGLPLVTAVLRSGSASNKKNRPISAAVVSPTRELAMQTAEQLEALGAAAGLRTICIYGGSPKDEQRNALRKGVDIVVATPGRLKDFLEEGSLSLSSASFVVLDEADRMLDKGFEEDIKQILSQTPPKDRRQTLMYTATWPQSVQALASTFMKKPVKITIGGAGGADGDTLQANTRIEQKVEVVDPRGKEQRLLQILKQQPQNERVLVFCLYKKEATRVEGFLQQRGLRVGGIHGDLKQEQRTRSLEAFKKGQTPILVATDVAARGLDIPEVKLVVNCTFPLTIEDYVHRIGRTGRAGKTGHAITLFTEHDKAHSGELINILKQANQPVPEELMKFGTTVKKKTHSTYGAFFKDVDMSKKGTKITFD